MAEGAEGEHFPVARQLQEPKMFAGNSSTDADLPAIAHTAALRLPVRSPKPMPNRVCLLVRLHLPYGAIIPQPKQNANRAVEKLLLPPMILLVYLPQLLVGYMRIYLRGGYGRMPE